MLQVQGEFLFLILFTSVFPQEGGDKGCKVLGGQKNETCQAGVRFCETKFVNNTVVKKGCASKLDN